MKLNVCHIRIHTKPFAPNGLNKIRPLPHHPPPPLPFLQNVYFLYRLQKPLLQLSVPSVTGFRSVHKIARNNSAPTGRIFMKFDI